MLYFFLRSEVATVKRDCPIRAAIFSFSHVFQIIFYPLCFPLSRLPTPLYGSSRIAFNLEDVLTVTITFCHAPLFSAPVFLFSFSLTTRTHKKPFTFRAASAYSKVAENGSSISTRTQKKSSNLGLLPK